MNLINYIEQEISNLRTLIQDFPSEIRDQLTEKLNEIEDVIVNQFGDD